MALHRGTLNRVATTSVGSRILARGVGIGFALYAAGAGIAFVMQLCLARWLGATGYGTYTYVIAWSGLLAIAAAMGFPMLVLRLLPEYSIREDWARVRGVLATSLVGTALIGGRSDVGNPPYVPLKLKKMPSPCIRILQRLWNTVLLSTVFN